MVANANDINTEKKVELFNLMMGEVPQPVTGTTRVPKAPSSERIVPPVQQDRSVGWIATFSAREHGGGSFGQFPERTCVVKTPAAIDIRPFLPSDLSSRNVLISMTASTDHQVIEAGRWGYFVKVDMAPNTQCMNFEELSDGVPIWRSGSMDLVTSSTSKEIPAQYAQQSKGMHTVTIKLACYVLAREFPVVSLTLQTPTGEWTRPTGGDFTVNKLKPLDRPPSVGGDTACVDKGG
jgi:hypothetical protein